MTHLYRLDESTNAGRILNQVADQLADTGPEDDGRTLTQQAYQILNPRWTRPQTGGKATFILIINDTEGEEKPPVTVAHFQWLGYSRLEGTNRYQVRFKATANQPHGTKQRTQHMARRIRRFMKSSWQRPPELGNMQHPSHYEQQLMIEAAERMVKVVTRMAKETRESRRTPESRALEAEEDHRQYAVWREKYYETITNSANETIEQRMEPKKR